MTNYYETLGVEHDASLNQIKRAFREKAKRLHPDIAGSQASGEMRLLLAAYEVLSNNERRRLYDQHFFPYGKKNTNIFNYRDFLYKNREDPAYRAKLIFYDLLNFAEDDAVAIWHDGGGSQFPLEKFLEREDWMDCGYLLAEELQHNGYYHEAFLLAVNILEEERARPYFKHFTEDVEIFIKELVRYRLRRAVNIEQWENCMRKMLTLGFPAQEEVRWLLALAEALKAQNKIDDAKDALAQACVRKPSLVVPKKLKSLCTSIMTC